jgi:hypothetical protein
MIKTHSVPRKELFTPSGEEDYPVHNGDLEAVRITTGVTESGKLFEIEDNWKRPGRSGRTLPESWTGHTTFVVRASARTRINDESGSAQNSSTSRS